MAKEYNFGFGTETFGQLDDPNHVSIIGFNIDYWNKYVNLTLQFKEGRIESIRISMYDAEKIGLINWSALKQIVK